MSLNVSEKAGCAQLKEFGGCNIDIQKCEIDWLSGQQDREYGQIFFLRSFTYNKTILKGVVFYSPCHNGAGFKSSRV